MYPGSSRHDAPDLGGRRLAPRLRLTALAASFLLTLFCIALPASSASAQETCSGVAVVVDFGSLASDPATGCAADPQSGLDALAQAGFSVTEVASIRGMVCRIDELPATDCGGAPPAKEYWSYWRAESGDAEWTFSTVGGSDARPEAGDVEGWSFGDGSAPPDRKPADVAVSDAAESVADQNGSYTWLLAVAALAVIGGLVTWRLRRERRA